MTKESKEYTLLKEALAKVREITDFVPDIAMVLGSGLAALGSGVKIICEINYKDIPNLPVSTAPGHNGRFLLGEYEGVKVIIMQGRVHYYEGYEAYEIVRPIRLMGMMGAKVLFLTNAAGGTNMNYKSGDLMIIKDHSMLFSRNPLIGENVEELGVRFPDMTHVYSENLRNIIKEVAKKNDIKVQEGVYFQLTGPSYETPADIKLISALGCDAVGMSTAGEATAANHMGMEICGISCITNMGAGILDVPLTIEDVVETFEAVAPIIQKLVWDSVKEIGKYIAEK